MVTVLLLSLPTVSISYNRKTKIVSSLESLTPLIYMFSKLLYNLSHIYIVAIKSDSYKLPLKPKEYFFFDGFIDTSFQEVNEIDEIFLSETFLFLFEFKLEYLTITVTSFS